MSVASQLRVAHRLLNATGPIASPTEAAIRAVLEPAEVDFLYFVARPDGSHEFTRTLAEHNRARVRIRQELDSLSSD